ncbi:hypothetical protein F3Y22_tig00117056pilonHSYRG00801 [Hibiscus syriacus]|uniref:RNase H type-1 domain-containing protein n=1 Tax=Hibiscus syriacus TaxID=106335 RepID=A0A6A2WB33_HIBSY|nr:hypothetical protein F3Y22_tig00117056pilonHSYRG00801 [Hibiscus syriacus]
MPWLMIRRHSRLRFCVRNIQSRNWLRFRSIDPLVLLFGDRSQRLGLSFIRTSLGLLGMTLVPLLNDAAISHIMGIPAPNSALGHDRCLRKHSTQGTKEALLVILFAVHAVPRQKQPSTFPETTLRLSPYGQPLLTNLRGRVVTIEFLKINLSVASLLHRSLCWEAVYSSKAAATAALLRAPKAVEICDVLRDHLGNFIVGFSRHLGRTTVIQSELWGIFEGLRLAWRRGFRHLILQIDSSDAFEMITAASYNSSITLVRAIFYLDNRD